MPSRNGRPNLVYVFADQLRRDALGYTGQSLARTPNIDRLASQSIDFCNAVSGSPVCAPYRASLFTGKYSSSTGMVTNEIRMNPNHRCLAHVLNDGGYHTSYIGKWHLWANELGNHDDPRNSHVPRGPHRLGFDGYWAAYNFHHEYVDTYYHTEGPDRITMRGYEPDGQTELACAQLEALRGTGKPFALFLSYGTPHDPWVPGNVPQEYLDRFRGVRFGYPPNYSEDDDPHADGWCTFRDGERDELPEWMRVYYAMVANLDWNVGRLMDRLEKLGLAEDTILVFTSDHGEMFGAHGRRAKNIFYDEAVRVPMLLRWPRKVEGGGRLDACLNTPDIMPTLLGLMGLEIPRGVEGSDLSLRVQGEAGFEPEEAFMQGMARTAVFGSGCEWRAIRSKRFTFARYRADGSELLFDNAADPYQQTNLAAAAEFSETAAAMRGRLDTRMALLSDTFEEGKWYEEHWTRDRVILRSATM